MIRAVLFHWDRPADLALVLQPAAIDWRLYQRYRLPVNTPATLPFGTFWGGSGGEGGGVGGGVGGSVGYVWSTWRPWSNASRVPPEFVDGTFAAEQARLVSITTNVLDQRSVALGGGLLV